MDYNIIFKLITIREVTNYKLKHKLICELKAKFMLKKKKIGNLPNLFRCV